MSWSWTNLLFIRSALSASARRWLDARGGVGSPQVLRGVRAKWPPTFGAAAELCSVDLGAERERDAALYSPIARRKRIGLTRGAERDVVRGPIADAVYPAQPFHRLVDVCRR